MKAQTRVLCLFGVFLTGAFCTSVCDELTVTNGEVTYSGNIHFTGSTATVTCQSGYTLVGTGDLSCVFDKSASDEIWSPAAPTCQADCGPLELDHGTITYSDSTYEGSEATFACSEGYTLMGETMATCQNDGNWSDSTPVCEEIVEETTQADAQGDGNENGNNIAGIIGLHQPLVIFMGIIATLRFHF